MITLYEHIQNLSANTSHDKEYVLKSLLCDKMIKMDEDSLLGYSFEELPEGKIIFAGWTDGEGKKIWDWVENIARENNCVAIYGISLRWKAFCRKYGMSPVRDCGDLGMIIKKEVVY